MLPWSCSTPRWTQAATTTRRCLSSTSTATSNHNKADVRKTGRVIFSGIQPTGVPHLGNYLGALSNWVTLQRLFNPNDSLFFSIVGWHALTLPQNPAILRQSKLDMLATLLAIGIDPKRAVIFHQDDIQCHTELAWILNCITPIGKLRRMTTWKSRLAISRNANDESEVDESMLNAGLLTYPVLQAADILAHRATHVPVGEDQTQHLELCRDIADIFNRTYDPKKRFFPLPLQLNTPSRRVLSLKDPSSKMSKSSPDLSSRILLTDTAAQIKSKVRGAVTDSIQGITYDPVNRPGTSNLLTILAAFTEEDAEDVATRYAGKGHGDLKNDVADAIEEMLKVPRAELERLRGDNMYLESVAKDGAERAQESSRATLSLVRKLVGLC